MLIDASGQGSAATVYRINASGSFSLSTGKAAEA